MKDLKYNEKVESIIGSVDNIYEKYSKLAKLEESVIEIKKELKANIVKDMINNGVKEDNKYLLNGFILSESQRVSLTDINQLKDWIRAKGFDATISNDDVFVESINTEELRKFLDTNQEQYDHVNGIKVTNIQTLIAPKEK